MNIYSTIIFALTATTIITACVCIIVLTVAFKE